jgi:hypothetical protein
LKATFDGDTCCEVLHPETVNELPQLKAKRLASQQYCGQGSLIGVSPKGNQILVIPMTCKSWGCPRCAKKKKAVWIRRLVSGRPQREMMLSIPAYMNTDTKATAIRLKKAFTNLVARIRKTYGELEYALVWELTKKGTPHLHVLTRGTYIPQSWLSTNWKELSGGTYTWISKVHTATAHALHLCKYLHKNGGQTAEAIAPLRLIQLSKHYELPTLPSTNQNPYEGWSFYRSHDSSHEIAFKIACSGWNVTTEVTPDEDILYTFPTDQDVLELLPDPPRHSPTVVIRGCGVSINVENRLKILNPFDFSQVQRMM